MPGEGGAAGIYDVNIYRFKYRFYFILEICIDVIIVIIVGRLFFCFIIICS